MKISSRLLLGAIVLCWATGSAAAPQSDESVAPHPEIGVSLNEASAFEFVLRNSHQLRDDCHQRIELKVDRIRTDPSSIQLSGKVDGQFWLCAEVFGSWLKARIGQQSADLDAMIALQRDGDCLRLRIKKLSLRPHAPYDRLFLGLDLKPELLAIITDRMVGHEFC